jgi:hypothetical protein
MRQGLLVVIAQPPTFGFCHEMYLTDGINQRHMRHAIYHNKQTQSVGAFWSRAIQPGGKMSSISPEL